MLKTVKNIFPNKYALTSGIFFLICLRIIFDHYQILKNFDFLETISYTGDDFYYYLSTVQNLRDLKILSFSIDPSAITNGFQYLWFIIQYGLGLIFFENSLEHIKSIMLVSSLLHIVFCTLVLYTFLKQGINIIISFISITFLGSSYVLFSHLWAGLEIQIYLILIIILVNRLLISSSEVNKKNLLIDAFIIILLFLSRSEGILFAPFLTLVRFWQIKKKLNIKYLILPPIIFFIFYFFFTYLIFGRITQSSGLFYSTFLERSFEEKIKFFIWFFTHYEQHFDNHSPLNIMSKLYHNNFFHYSVIIVFFLNFIKNSYESSFKKFKYVFFVLIFQYIIIALFYSFNQKIFLIRYTLISIVPITIFLTCIMQDIFVNLKIFVRQIFFQLHSGYKNKKNKISFFISNYIHTEIFEIINAKYLLLKNKNFFIFPIKALIFIILIFYFNNTLDKNIDHYQKNSKNRNELHSFYKSGLELQKLKLDGGVGGWNSGMIGFASGNMVLNLDGRINSEIFSYKNQDGNILEIDIIKNLIEYLEEKNIRYVVDGKAVVTDIKPWFYKTSTKCINELFVFEKLLDPKFTAWYHGIALFKIDFENGKKHCLE